MSRFSELPPAVQQRLRAKSQRARVARAIVEHLPVGSGFLTTYELASLTGFDRVDVANGLGLLRELGVAHRGEKKVGEWVLTLP